MTPTQFRAALASLGMTQRGFAAHVGANERTVRRWVEGHAGYPDLGSGDAAADGSA